LFEIKVEYSSEILKPYVDANFELRDLQDEIVRNDELSTIDKLNFGRNKLKGGAACGQLTNIGEQQLFQLGQLIRKHYMKDLKFLSPNYDSHQF
jgi:hypothetical protein